jgi:hypothetical protein
VEKGGEVDTLLDAESTWTGVRLSWWTFGRPSCELLDLAEKSWDGLVKAEKDLADVIAKVLPSTGAHTVTVERKGPGILPTGVLERLVELSSSHAVIIIRGPAGSVCYSFTHSHARARGHRHTHTHMNTLTHVQTHTASPCSLAFTLQAALHACCAAAYIL